jgi:tetratricopeptide (TPR) repeat protein
VPGQALERLPEAIGKYRVLERLGAGAMGIVYKCSQPGLDRPVAVKVLVAAGHATGAQILRFQREARAAALLTHPNVVQVFDVGSEGELPYYVMEFVDGCSLAQLIATPTLTVETTLRLVYHVARALEAAHTHGIIHRDIKPSNILIHKSGQLKLTDFGLAKSLHDGPGLSRTGDLVGTPRYMSPEQVLAAPEDIDARTDIYSLGAVMYEMLTGKPPVDGPSVLSILRRLTDEDPIAIRDLKPDVPQEVAAICERAMAKEREARFATTGEFAEAIQAYLLEKLLRLPNELGSLPAPPPPLALPIVVSAGGRTSPSPWRRRAFVGAAIILGTAALWALVGLLVPRKDPDTGPSPSAVEPDDLPALRRHALDRAHEVLHGPRQQPDMASSGDLVKALLEALSAVLKRAPEDQEIRLLRAQANRRAGEYLAAVEDASEVLRREPSNLAAATERLLASYQLYILYLGNINELLLRPNCFEQLRGDIEGVRKRGGPAQKYAAELIQALARQDYGEAARIAQAGLPRGVRPDSVADWSMLEADALFHGAEMAYAEEVAADEEDKGLKKSRREDLLRRATQAFRRGLDADPNHVGALFLKANSFQRRAGWEASEMEGREVIIRRYKPAFESACDRLRNATVRTGCDTAIARAVLLSNLGWDDAALDQVKDALSCRPTVQYLHTFKAWLHLQVRSDSILTTEEAKQLLADLQPVLDTSAEDFSLYFVRALLQAAAGQWEAAREDLRKSRRKLGKDDLPTTIATYNEWFGRANASTTEYLEATLSLLWALPVHADLRIRIATELMQRLNDDTTTQKDGLKADRVRAMRGWTHFHLARAFAGKEDRAHVLEHAREALQLQIVDLNPDFFRKDAALSAWNEDQEFKALYSLYEKP